MKEQIAGRGLAVLFILLAVALLLVERLPPVLAIAAVIVLCIGAQWRTVTGTLRAAPVLWAVGALLVWMLLSASWGIAGAEGLGRGARIAAMIAAAAMLPPLALSLPMDARYRAARWGLVAAILAIALLFIDTMFDMPLLRTSRYLFNREIFTDAVPAVAERAEGYAYYRNLYLTNRLTHLSSIVAIVLLPVGTVMWRLGHRLGALAVSAAAVAGLLLAPAQTPLLALLFGVVIAGVVCLPAISRSRWTAPVGAAALAAGIIAVPLLAQTMYSQVPHQAGGIDPSIFHRLAIWDHVAGLIAERPVAGYGIEAARIIGRDGLNVAEDAKGFAVAFQALPLHPHNAAIQIWLELGGVGALIFALFVYLMTIRVWSWSNDSLLRAGLVGGWIAALAVAHLSYGIWQYWWLATLGMIACLLALVVSSERPRPKEDG